MKTKTWYFKSKKEAIDFFLWALAFRIPQIVEILQPDKKGKWKVKITKLEEEKQ